MAVFKGSKDIVTKFDQKDFQQFEVNLNYNVALGAEVFIVRMPIGLNNLSVQLKSSNIGGIGDLEMFIQQTNDITNNADIIASLTDITDADEILDPGTNWTTIEVDDFDGSIFAVRFVIPPPKTGILDKLFVTAKRG